MGFLFIYLFFTRGFNFSMWRCCIKSIASKIKVSFKYISFFVFSQVFHGFMEKVVAQDLDTWNDGK